MEKGPSRESPHEGPSSGLAVGDPAAIATTPGVLVDGLKVSRARPDGQGRPARRFDVAPPRRARCRSPPVPHCDRPPFRPPGAFGSRPPRCRYRTPSGQRAPLRVRVHIHRSTPPTLISGGCRLRCRLPPADCLNRHLGIRQDDAIRRVVTGFSRIPGPADFALQAGGRRFEPAWLHWIRGPEGRGRPAYRRLAVRRVPIPTTSMRPRRPRGCPWTRRGRRGPRRVLSSVTG